jgi:hypothetical protein
MRELHPEHPAVAQAWTPQRAIPISLREFGKYPRTSDWWPGDLILIRSLAPDRVSKTISLAQQRGGYSVSDSSWTHAAVYIGDGQHICEATGKSVRRRGSVHITPLWEYCGSHALLVRRSKHVVNRDIGWQLATYALTHLNKPYDVSYIAKLGVQAFSGQGFWQSERRARIRRSALICSTLYADAHSRVTSRVLGEASGLCLPAYLSVSDVLTDVTSVWAPIVS